MIIENTKIFTIAIAENGKVFKDKITGDILTDRLYLGCNDSPDNYEEIEPLIEEEEINDVIEDQKPTSLQT